MKPTVEIIRLHCISGSKDWMDTFLLHLSVTLSCTMIQKVMLGLPSCWQLLTSIPNFVHFESEAYWVLKVIASGLTFVLHGSLKENCTRYKQRNSSNSCFTWEFSGPLVGICIFKLKVWWFWIALEEDDSLTKLFSKAGYFFLIKGAKPSPYSFTVTMVTHVQNWCFH